MLTIYRWLKSLLCKKSEEKKVLEKVKLTKKFHKKHPKVANKHKKGCK